MIIIVGALMVLGAVLTGFLWEGGKLGALIQPAELVVIGGAALGALVIMSSRKVLIDMVRGIVQCVKGTPYNKRAYDELFKVLYDLFRLARRDGLISLESHLTEPENSAIFAKYPRFAANHHVMEFTCGALSPVLEGTVKPDQLAGLLEADIKLVEVEHHGPLGVLSKTADAMPGFGIVAAVLGIVITMQAIDGPPEEIGEKVGARPGGHLPRHPHVLRVRGPAGGRSWKSSAPPRWPTSAPSPRRSKASSTTWRRRSSSTRRGGAWPASFAPPARNSKTCSSRSKPHNAVEFKV